MNADKKTIDIFIAYSQKDKAHLEALRIHAMPLVRKGHIQMWYDGEIIAGELWDKAIKAKLEAADIILMLVSPNSLASEYFYNEEVAQAIKRHQEGTAHVVPILLSACFWKKTPLAALQGLPKGLIPINQWPDRDDAWHDVLSGVSDLIDKIEQATKKALSPKPEVRLEQKKQPGHTPQPSAAEEHAWDITVDTDTPVAYKKFLDRFPNGFYAAKARVRLDAFEADETTWEFAIDNGAEKAIQKYLDKYPNGLHAAEARQKIAAFEAERKETARKKREAEEAAQKAEAARKRKEEETAERRRIDPFYDLMIPIKGGTFEMGDTFGEGEDREKPVHRVTLADYGLCKYPVTQGLWKAIMGENNNPSQFKGDDMLPVEMISWDDAQAFLKALNQKTGGQYRLPTEAEWEYAAREGGKKVRFGNGKDIAHPAEMNFNATQNHKQPYSVVGEYRQKTTPVNRFQPNALGLYDMAGNVWEWCPDFYAADYYGQCQAQGTVSNPQGPDTGESRVLRGGSWISNPRYCRAAYRHYYAPTGRGDSVGFRVALSLQ